MQVIEGNDFYVSRTAYRDNSSRYTLNGKTIQFKEIAKVLHSCGIDLIHNRFLILQVIVFFFEFNYFINLAINK